MIDPLCLIHLFKDPTIVVSKKEAKKMPVVGKIIDLIDGIYLDRESPRDALNMVKESKKHLINGNNVAIKADAVEDLNIIFDLNGEIVLPDKVNAIMSDNSKQEIAVEWKNVDIEAMKSGGVAKYSVEGTAGGMKAYCYISMIEYNYLDNWSFEEGESPWVATQISKFDELKVEDKVSDSVTGTKHYHFWGASANTVEFTLEQQVTGLKTGKYKYSVSIMGGDGGDTEIYAYIKINGQIAYRADAKITVYDEWHTANINNIVYNIVSHLKMEFNAL